MHLFVSLFVCLFVLAHFIPLLFLSCVFILLFVIQYCYCYWYWYNINVNPFSVGTQSISELSCCYDSTPIHHSSRHWALYVDWSSSSGRKIITIKTDNEIKCDSTYQKVPVIRRHGFQFELWGCKIKISQNMVQKLILRFHMFWNLQCT